MPRTSTPVPLEDLKLRFEEDYEDNVTEHGKATHRQTWAGKLDFLVSMIGSAVGLGNVWRFPFLCYRNGGGTFLIPYFIALLFIAIPLQFLEVSIGQLMSRAAFGAWNICPIIKGTGIFQFACQVVAMTSYVLIISWAIYYACLSFSNPLPWSTCNNTWNTEDCVTNFTGNTSGVSSTTEFWELKVLGLSNGIDDAGSFQWQLYIACVFIWFILFLCLHRGVTFSGKMMYPLTIIPYVLLFMLLGYVSTMDGSAVGIYYFLTPDWTSLKNSQVWADAGKQVFYSLSVGNLVSIGLGSHNPYSKRSYIDCLVTATVNSVTSLIAGIVIFMTLGYMSLTTGVDIDKVAESGAGLAFVTYPKALMTMPLAPLWSVIFFAMLVLLGLSSIAMTIEAMLALLTDIFPAMERKGSLTRIIVLLTYCIFQIICTIPYALGNGMYFLQLIEFYNGNRTQIIGAILECIGVIYVFGGNRFIDAVNRMYNIKAKKVLLLLWGLVTPVSLGLLLISSISAYTTSLSFRRGSTGEIYYYPSQWIAVGWILEIFHFLIIPGFGVYLFVKSRGSFSERIRSIFRPQLEAFQTKRFNSFEAE